MNESKTSDGRFRPPLCWRNNCGHSWHEGICDKPIVTGSAYSNETEVYQCGCRKALKYSEVYS